MFTAIAVVPPIFTWEPDWKLAPFRVTGAGSSAMPEDGLTETSEAGEVVPELEPEEPEPEEPDPEEPEPVDPDEPELDEPEPDPEEPEPDEPEPEEPELDEPEPDPEEPEPDEPEEPELDEPEPEPEEPELDEPEPDPEEPEPDEPEEEALAMEAWPVPMLTPQPLRSSPALKETRKVVKKNPRAARRAGLGHTEEKGEGMYIAIHLRGL